MQCHAMYIMQFWLCDVMWCDGWQCNAMQCNAMQCKCNAVQCNATQRNAMQCYATQRNAMQRNAMQRNAMQCNTMQCNACTSIYIYTSASPNHQTLLTFLFLGSCNFMQVCNQGTFLGDLDTPSEQLPCSWCICIPYVLSWTISPSTA